MPAWKLPNCIQALNAQPVDLAHIAEVIEIQFASDGLVAVAAKCLTSLLQAQAEEASARKSRIDNAVVHQSS